jgi:hypothetical protein
MVKKILFSMLMVLCFTSLAMAGANATGVCPPNAPDDCYRVYTLDDMGYFDENDDWQWDEQFYNLVGPQLSHTPQCVDSSQWNEDGLVDFIVNWQICFMPKKLYFPESIEKVRVDRRKFPDPNMDHTRFSFELNGEREVIRAPWLYQNTPPYSDPNDPVPFYGAIMIPDGPVFNGSQLYLLSRNYEINELTAPEVQYVSWNGSEGEPFINERTEYMYMMKYDTGLREWYHNWYEEMSPVYHYKFYNEITTLDPQKFEIILTDGRVFETVINPTNVDDMPRIPAFITDTVDRVTKSGKVISTNQPITTPNINIREVYDPWGDVALVIQWSEPDGAFFGNSYGEIRDTFMLRIFVTKFSDELKKEVYLWIDCPIQTGTVVINPEHYNWLKDKIVEEGMTIDPLTIGIMYRTVTGKSGGLDYPNYHNRGYSDLVSFSPSM